MNVDELQTEVQMRWSSDLQAAEEWRLAKAARPVRVRMTSDKLLDLASAAASRTVAAAGQVVGAVRSWVAGSSDPQEECC